MSNIVDAKSFSGVQNFFQIVNFIDFLSGNAPSLCIPLSELYRLDPFGCFNLFSSFLCVVVKVSMEAL